MKITALTLAVSASLIVHLAALVQPGWYLPAETPDEKGAPLTAQLMAAPAEQPVAKPQSKVRKPAPIAGAPTASLGHEPEKNKPKTEPVVSEPEALAQKPSMQPEPEASAPMPEPVAQAAAPEPSPSLDGWARQGRVHYSSSYWGLPVSGEQVWSHDEAQFNASLRGTVPIKGELLKQESVGRIAGGKPVSDSFNETFNASKYETRFAPDGSKLDQVRKGDPREVPTGGYALDMLALMHYMALQPLDAPAFDVFVVSFRGSVSRVTVEQRPPHSIDLPAGTMTARQFHAEARNGALKIDIWLASDYQNAPVRIRVEDAGGSYDLKADELELDGKLLLRKAVASE